jgi:glycosyltransferase involved in cell wall biosynthesis
MLNVAKALVRVGASVRTALPVGPDQLQVLEWFARDGVQVELNRSLRQPGAERYSYGDVLQLSRFIRSTASDAVNFHYGGNNISLKDVIAVRASGRRRCVVSVHHAVKVDNSRYARSNRLAGILADRVVVTTPLLRHILVDSGVPRRKITVIPLGLDSPEIRPTRRVARSQLGIPDSAFLICSLSRLVAYKGIADVIDAVAQLGDLDNDVWLVVAGDGPERETLEARARASGLTRVRFLGQVKDTADVYAAADLFVLPSREEGFGQVYIEAAFYGVPSIGADVGGVKYAISNGKTGILVHPGDVVALVQAIQRLRHNPALLCSMGQAACEHAHQSHGLDQLGRAYQRVLFGV